MSQTDQTIYEQHATAHPLPKHDVRYNRLTTICLLCLAAQHPTLTSAMQLHIDGGANRSITPEQSALLQYRNIKPIHIRGVNADDPAVTCTGYGYLPWRAPDGTTLLVCCYYSPKAADTIISPTDVVLNHLASFSAWQQYSNLQTGMGHIEFIRTDKDTSPLHFPLTASNGLWFYHCDAVTDYNPNTDSITYQLIMNRLTTTATYELYHARLGHPGTSVMSTIHLHADGVPKLNPPALFCCDTCIRTKATKRATTATQVKQDLTDATQAPQGQHSSDGINPDSHHTDTEQDTTAPGSHFHIDMGFVRGTQYSSIAEDGKLVTSLDGFNSCVIIVDRRTRYTWVILTRSKIPQIDLISKFLAIHGSKTAAQRCIRTDQGRELWRSHQFHQMC